MVSRLINLVVTSSLWVWIILVCFGLIGYVDWSLWLFYFWSILSLLMVLLFDCLLIFGCNSFSVSSTVCLIAALHIGSYILSIDFLLIFIFDSFSLYGLLCLVTSIYILLLLFRLFSPSLVLLFDCFSLLIIWY